MRLSVMRRPEPAEAEVGNQLVRREMAEVVIFQPRRKLLADIPAVTNGLEIVGRHATGVDAREGVEHWLHAGDDYHLGARRTCDVLRYVADVPRARTTTPGRASWPANRRSPESNGGGARP